VTEGCQDPSPRQNGGPWSQARPLEYPLLQMPAEPALRFDVYGRYVLIVERHAGTWRVLQLGDDGKRGLRGDITVPPDLPPDGIAQYLDDLLHESGRPGARVRRLT
jgi:hypothetical protein